MKPPRIRLRWLMVAVAVVALNLAAWRSLFPENGVRPRIFLLGALPMANIIALVALAMGRRPSPRRFVAGFAATGGAAMAALLAWAWLAPLSLVGAAMMALTPIGNFLGLGPEGVPVYVAASGVLVVPQLGIALIGGVVFAMSRRSPSRHHAEDARSTVA